MTIAVEDGPAGGMAVVLVEVEDEGAGRGATAEGRVERISISEVVCVAD
jgi:hypothetical protein